MSRLLLPGGSIRHIESLGNVIKDAGGQACKVVVVSRDIARAMIVGNALLEAQNTDPAADGRFRQAYMAGSPDGNGAFVTPGLSFFQGSAVGDVAWAGIALAQLYARTRMQKYLDGALRAATRRARSCSRARGASRRARSLPARAPVLSAH